MKRLIRPKPDQIKQMTPLAVALLACGIAGAQVRSSSGAGLGLVRSGLSMAGRGAAWRGKARRGKAGPG